MTTKPADTQLATWDTDHGEVQASPAILRKLFRAPKATDFEVWQFIQICKAQRLNPFLRQAYLIKYGNNPAQMVTGKETFTQRAEAHPDFDGMEAGIIVLRGDEAKYLVGTFKMPDDKLVGGWTRVHRKSQKWAIEKSVDFSEYDTGMSLWKSKPATMIEKVAIVQGLREAFPAAFTGLYDHAELGKDLPVIDAPAILTGEDDTKALPEGTEDHEEMDAGLATALDHDVDHHPSSAQEAEDRTRAEAETEAAVQLELGRKAQEAYEADITERRKAEAAAMTDEDAHTPVTVEELKAAATRQDSILPRKDGRDHG